MPHYVCTNIRLSTDEEFKIDYQEIRPIREFNSFRQGNISIFNFCKKQLASTKVIKNSLFTSIRGRQITLSTAWNNALFHKRLIGCIINEIIRNWY